MHSGSGSGSGSESGPEDWSSESSLIPSSIVFEELKIQLEFT